jgi:uroporphyrinogen-III synthase
MVVTRARAQASELGRHLEARGADVIYCPVIRCAPPLDPSAMQHAVSRLPWYDWLILTSANGVAALVAELTRQGGDVTALSQMKIACVGPATADALSVLGVRPQLMPEEFKSAQVATELLAQVDQDTRVLMVRAKDADPELPRRLRERLSQVDDVIGYRSEPDLQGIAEVKRLLETDAVDAITFTSPSIVTYFVAAAGTIPQRVLLAAIGPVTAARMRELNLNPAVVAREHTAVGLVEAICDHYERNESG